MVKNPTTESAAAALTALLADIQGADVALRVCLGEDMGRPSTLVRRTIRGALEVRTRVVGRCAAMFTGTFELD